MTDDNMLSQEEINALLNVTNSEEDTDDEAAREEVESSDTDESEDMSDYYLTELEKDALGEIGNISLGSSATTLSTLLNQKVDITTPSVSVVRKTGLKEEFPYEHVKLQVNYMEGFTGENIFLMKSNDAAIISDIMLGGDGKSPNDELTEIELSAVQEAMNQMMGSSATSMSTVFSKKVDISPPTVDYEDIDKLEEVFEQLSYDEVFVRILFNLRIGDLINSNIMQIMPLPFAKELVEELLSTTESATTAVPHVEELEEPVRVTPEANITEPVTRQAEVMQEQASQAQAANQTMEPQYLGRAVDSSASVQEASFAEFEPVDLPARSQQNLDLLLDIPLQVTVELGRTKQKLQDILELDAGSIVELDKLAGEPVDVLVNSKLIAKGEVVVIDENFGVRITDIVSQRERLLNLN
ncbi:MAG TPA: flagellar motor switch phosphatase FliY [Pseudogracilibacillus sp.]|nr:flagellar motor switch phosphatase FliY [Pseudogracilibacillus sp.]